MKNCERAWVANYKYKFPVKKTICIKEKFSSCWGTQNDKLFGKRTYERRLEGFDGRHFNILLFMFLSCDLFLNCLYNLLRLRLGCPFPPPHLSYTLSSLLIADISSARINKG